MKIIGVGLIVFGAMIVSSYLLVSGPPSDPCVDSTFTPEPDPATGELIDLEARLITDDLVQPSDMFVLPGSPRLFAVEKPGRIVIVEDGVVGDTPVIDMRSIVESDENEQGLLTALPHPDVASNCLIYLFYTDLAGDSQLVQARISGTAQPVIDIRSFRTVITIPQPHVWHQSGSMIFGPDGYLWVTVGDGGNIGDPRGHGQNPNTLLATVIRLDVSDLPYRIPPDNPFVDSEEGADEVWAYGLRNPWRIWIDDGNVYIPDVGQFQYEEIDIVPIDEPGHNFGWSVLEGFDCYDRDEEDGVVPDCDPTEFTLPVHGYIHENTGCAIVGGPVYRGRDIPELDGHYFYADYCRGWVRTMRYTDGEVTEDREWDALDMTLVTTFAVDWVGEIYYANLDGNLWKIVPVRG